MMSVQKLYQNTFLSSEQSTCERGLWSAVPQRNMKIIFKYLGINTYVG